MTKEMSIEAGKGLYEIGVHFIASLAETQAQEEFKTLQDNLSKKAEIVTVADLNLIDLAYTMVTTINRKNERFDTAYFGQITFISTPDQISELDAYLAGQENVLRHIVIKTVPEAAEALAMCEELVKEETEESEEESDTDKKEEDSKTEEKSEDAAPEETTVASDDIDQKIDEIVS